MRNTLRRFRNDQVHTWEGGIRLGQRGWTPFDAYLSLSYTRWRDIQADFIDSSGFPSTANIGDGRIASLSGAVAMRPVPGLSFELGAVYNHSRVDELFAGELRTIAAATSADGMAPEFSTLLARLGQIPNVAHYAVRGSVDYVAPVGDEDFRLNGWAHYVGPSRLGIGPILGEGQGDYLDTGLAMRIGNTRRGLTLTLTNLLDSRGNRFALGSPFLIRDRNQITPLQPRTLRLGFDLSF